MSEVPQKYTVYPTTQARAEKKYEPLNGPLFQHFHALRMTHGAILVSRSVKESGIMKKISPLRRMVSHILDNMPVWQDSTDDFKQTHFHIVERIFYEEELRPEDMEDTVIQKILALRETYEREQRITVEVVTRNDQVAAVYQEIEAEIMSVLKREQEIRAAIAGLDSIFDEGEKSPHEDFDDVDDRPTDPDIKALKRAAS